MRVVALRDTLALRVQCGGAAMTSAETMAEGSTPYAFLSYSRKDQAFAAHLARDLRAHGIHLWFDQLDIAPGDDWDEAIQRALHGARAVVFIVSADSVQSDNVLNELTVAVDSKKWVIPVMIAAVAVPLRIARMQRIDFVSNYGAALAHLVAYMQGGGSRTSALSAIAASQFQSGETHSPSLEPVQRSAPTASRRASWLVPAVIGAGVAVLGMVGLVLVLAAIGTGGSPTADAAVAEPSVQSALPNVSSELVEGQWLGACLPQEDGQFQRISMTFTRSSCAVEFTYHQVADCTRPLFAVTLLYDLVRLAPIKAGTYAADYRVQNISIVLT